MQENFETKEEINSHLVHEVIGHVQRSTLKDRTIFEENNPHLVLENCLFNVDTFQKEDFTPDYYALAKMPVKFEPERDYHNSLFWTFINEIPRPEGRYWSSRRVRRDSEKEVPYKEILNLLRRDGYREKHFVKRDSSFDRSKEYF